MRTFISFCFIVYTKTRMHKLWKLFVCYHGLWCSDQTDMFDFISVDMNNKSSKLYKWINLINNIISYIQGKHQLLLHFLTKNNDIPKFYFTSKLYQNMIMLCIITCLLQPTKTRETIFYFYIKFLFYLHISNHNWD